MCTSPSLSLQKVLCAKENLVNGCMLAFYSQLTAKVILKQLQIILQHNALHLLASIK